MLEEGVHPRALAYCVHFTLRAYLGKAMGGSASQQSCRETARWEPEGAPLIGFPMLFLGFRGRKMASLGPLDEPRAAGNGILF